MIVATGTIELDLITTEDVANVTGIPVGTLRYYRSTGKGPASFRLAGRVRYRRSEVLGWITDQERATRRGGAHGEGEVA